MWGRKNEFSHWSNVACSSLVLAPKRGRCCSNLPLKPPKSLVCILDSIVFFLLLVGGGGKGEFFLLVSGCEYLSLVADYLNHVEVVILESRFSLRVIMGEGQDEPRVTCWWALQQTCTWHIYFARRWSCTPGKPWLAWLPPTSLMMSCGNGFLLSLSLSLYSPTVDGHYIYSHCPALVFHCSMDAAV